MTQFGNFDSILTRTSIRKQETMNVVQSLGEYVNKVLDTNKDGRVSFKDFLDLFPNNSVAIAILFVDLVVGAAEYRDWETLCLFGFRAACCMLLSRF